MAQGGPVEKQDLITDDAVAVPLVLEKNFEKAIEGLEKLRSSAIAFNKEIGSTESTKKLGDATVQLNKEQQELAKIQNQIATAVAKNNDQYRAYQERLKNVNDELKNNRAQSDGWVKQATQQNSSLIKLEDALNKNRVAYANLRTEQDRNGKSGKDLLAVIQSQDKGVKAIRDSMGQAQAHVGGYREAIEKALPALQKFAPEAVEAGEAVASFGSKLFTIVTSPISYVLAGVAAGFTVVSKAIELYKEDTIEGADYATLFAQEWESSLSVVNNKLKELGKNSAEFTDDFKKGFLDLSILLGAALTGNLSETYRKLQEAHEQATKNAKIANEIRKEEIILTVENADLNLQKDKAMYEAREKLRNSDQERYEALIKSKELGKEIRENQQTALNNEIELQRGLIKLKYTDLRADQNALDLLADEHVRQLVGYEDIEKLAQLEAKRFDIEDKRYQGARRRQALEAALVNDALKRETDADKTLEESKIQTAETIFKHEVDVNQRIVGNQEKTLEEQLDAQRRLTEAQVNLSELGVKKQIQAARQATFDRIELTREETDQISEEAKGNFSELLRLTIEAKNKKLEVDASYIKQTHAITEEAKRVDEGIEREGNNKLRKIYIDNHAYFLSLHERFLKEDQQKELDALNESFIQGKIGLVQYGVEKARITNGGNEEQLEQQKKYYLEQINELKKYLQTAEGLYSGDKDKILATIAQLEKGVTDITQKEADKQLAIREKIKGLTIQLQTEMVNAFQAIADNQIQTQINTSNAIITDLERRKDETIQAAGDNKNAIFHIEKEFNAKIAAENKKVHDAEIRKARLDKELAEARIIISTATSIAEAYSKYNYITATIIAALLAAIGAAQLSAVASTPIPTYKGGTDNHPGGPALVADAGAELVQEPGRKAVLYDIPNTVIPSLAVGSKVYTAEETQAIVEGNLFNEPFRNQVGIGRASRHTVIIDNSAVAKELHRFQPVDVVGQANELYTVRKHRDGSREWIRSKIFTK